MNPPLPEKRIQSTEDLAHHLGLSRWTVSRVLNGHDGVHAKTRERVLSTIAELDFRPNAMARGLRGGKTGLIGVCFQEIESPILAKKVSTLQSLLREEGLRGVLELTSGDTRLEADIIHHFISLKVDGIILIGSTLEAEHSVFQAAREAQIPLIAVDPVHPLPVRRIILKRQYSMQLVLEHLHAQGLRQFALLGLENDAVYGQERIKGLRSAAVKLGLNYEQDFNSYVDAHVPDWSYDYGYSLGQRLVATQRGPLGVIALNDRIAIGAMQAMREAGRSIPQDYAVVGYDALEISEWSHPPLTTVSQESPALMSVAVTATKHITDRDTAGCDEVTYIKPRLIRRASTARFHD